MTYRRSMTARRNTRQPDPRRWESFKTARREMAEWIERKFDTFEFARSMKNAVLLWGDLTLGQSNAVQKLMARDAERTQNLTTGSFGRLTVDDSALREAFTRVREQGFVRISLTFGYKTPDPTPEDPRREKTNLIEFSPAPNGGRNPGAIYVTLNQVYMGRLQNGLFIPSSMYLRDGDLLERVRAIVADPAEASRASGLNIGICACCGLTLTNPESIARGIGPICAGKWGF